MGKHVEWRRLPYTSFEINRLGDLRKYDSKLVMDKSFTHKFYDGRSGATRDVNATILRHVNEVFPEYKR